MKVHWSDDIFDIRSENEFRAVALKVFHHQYDQNPVYRLFVDTLGVSPLSVHLTEDIPFLPISFFKTRKVITSGQESDLIFESSGTTGMQRSAHHVADLSLYDKSILKGFRYFYGEPSDYRIMALVPAPAKHPQSSLAYMACRLMEAAHPGEKYFLLNDFGELADLLHRFFGKGRKVLLIGLTHALVEFSETFRNEDPGLIVMETGGMKGQRKEMIREELHQVLSDRFGVEKIHSEYGMSELLSQAYSQGNGIFSTPPWMKIMIRDANDPLSWQKPGLTGAISIIDLANFNSCPFIATQDLGRANQDGTFEVLGRFDNSELRGCNLMF